MSRLKYPDESGIYKELSVAAISDDSGNVITPSKIGNLSNLSTSEKSNLTGAISEVKNEVITHKAEKATQLELGHVKVDGDTITIDENGVISGARKQTLLYSKGFENIDITGGWVEGYSAGGGILTKDVDNVFFALTTESTSERTIVTNNEIDLSKFKTLHVDMEMKSLGTLNATRRSDVVISEDKDGAYNENVVANSRFTINLNEHKRTIVSLDVNALQGNYFLRIHAWTRSSNRNHELTVYRIWGE